jgi:hypothetical protein
MSHDIDLDVKIFIFWKAKMIDKQDAASCDQFQPYHNW